MRFAFGEDGAEGARLGAALSEATTDDVLDGGPCMLCVAAPVSRVVIGSSVSGSCVCVCVCMCVCASIFLICLVYLIYLSFHPSIHPSIYLSI